MDANGREKETQMTRMNTDFEKLKRNMDGQDEQDFFLRDEIFHGMFVSIRGLKSFPVFYPQILRMRAD